MVRMFERCDHSRHKLLRFLRCIACGLLELLPGRTDYKNIKIREDTFTPEYITYIQDAENSDGLCICVVCKDITSLGDHTNETTMDSGRGGVTRSRMALGSR